MALTVSSERTRRVADQIPSSSGPNPILARPTIACDEDPTYPTRFAHVVSRRVRFGRDPVRIPSIDEVDSPETWRSAV